MRWPVGDAAITSEVAGTTRDVIEVRMDIAGLAVTLLDTAGLRDTQDQVEGIGVGRALARAREADLRIFLLDGDDIPMLEPGPEDIVVSGKADLAPHGVDDHLAVSGKTGAGLKDLLAAVESRLSHRVTGAGVITRGPSQGRDSYGDQRYGIGAE